MSATQPQPSTAEAPVLILGAGVNGLCIARELVLNGVPVVVVDKADIGGGASAKSSRLIHGGLRYLEYAEFKLVRESLDERTRLLELARHFVRPLKLHIPVRRRTGGLIRAGVRFLGGARLGWLQRLLDRLHISAERGLWSVKIGLTLYDWIARSGKLPRHEVTQVTGRQHPPIDRQQYRYSCSYWDAQMLAPERFCLALIEDIRQISAKQGLPSEILNYHEVQLQGDGVVITPTAHGQNQFPRQLRPAMIVNATGAWGDLTLSTLPVEAPRLFGGTRGSHIITRQTRIQQALGDDAIYAEAPDGRLVFILPWDGATLIGTTDERFEGPPEQAIADDREIGYLIEMVNRVLPDVHLTQQEIESHYSGVRPLPYVPAGRTAAISRDHAIDRRTTTNRLRIDTVVGGKLTTCRALGEQVAADVLNHLGRSVTQTTADRVIPGCENYPAPSELPSTLSQLANDSGTSPHSVAAVWRLLGTRTGPVLSEVRQANPTGSLPLLTGTEIPVGVVDWIIRHEFVRTVADLVERRLLLVFLPHLTSSTLVALEERIREIHGHCASGATDAADRLREHYGVKLVPQQTADHPSST